MWSVRETKPPMVKKGLYWNTGMKNVKQITFYLILSFCTVK